MGGTKLKLDLKYEGREGNQAMSQSCCARTFAFTVGVGGEACQSPECNQEALCRNGWNDSDFLRLRSCSEADEQEM